MGSSICRYQFLRIRWTVMWVLNAGELVCHDENQEDPGADGLLSAYVVPAGTRYPGAKFYELVRKCHPRLIVTTTTSRFEC